MKKYMTFKEVRNLFFNEFPMYKGERKKGKKQGDFTCDCRTSFCDYVDYLHKDGRISDKQAFNITLIG